MWPPICFNGPAGVGLESPDCLFDGGDGVGTETAPPVEYINYNGVYITSNSEGDKAGVGDGQNFGHFQKWKFRAVSGCLCPRAQLCFNSITMTGTGSGTNCLLSGAVSVTESLLSSLLICLICQLGEL